LQIAAPRAKTGIVDRIVDAGIALQRLGGQTVDRIEVPVVSAPRGIDLANHVSSCLSPIPRDGNSLPQFSLWKNPG